MVGGEVGVDVEVAAGQASVEPAAVQDRSAMEALEAGELARKATNRSEANASATSRSVGPHVVASVFGVLPLVEVEVVRQVSSAMASNSS